MSVRAISRVASCFLLGIGVVLLGTVLELEKARRDIQKDLGTLMDWAVTPIRDINVLGLPVLKFTPDMTSTDIRAPLEAWRDFVLDYEKTLQLTKDPPSVALLTARKRQDILEREGAIMAELPALLTKVTTMEDPARMSPKELSLLQVHTSDLMAINADFAHLFAADVIAQGVARGRYAIPMAIVLSAVLILLAVAFYWYTEARVLRPLVRLEQGLGHLAQGDLRGKF